MDIQIKSFSTEMSQELLHIYRPFVLENAVSFEYELPTVGEFGQRLSALSKNENLLVAQVKEQVIGYAYSSNFRSRAAYRFVKEVSVYVHEDQKGKGVGRFLYEKLFQKLKSQSIDSVIAVITLPNDNSVQFHQKLAFTEVGKITRAGKKFDKWHDIAIMQRSISGLSDI